MSAYPTSYEDAINEIERLRKVERAAAEWLRAYTTPALVLADIEACCIADVRLVETLQAIGVKPAEAL